VYKLAEATTQLENSEVLPRFVAVAVIPCPKFVGT